MDALARVDLPTTSRVPVKIPLDPVNPVEERLVVEALVVVKVLMKALVKLSPDPDTCVVDARPRVVNPDTSSLVMVVVASVLVPVTAKSVVVE